MALQVTQVNHVTVGITPLPYPKSAQYDPGAQEFKAHTVCKSWLKQSGIPPLPTTQQGNLKTYCMER